MTKPSPASLSSPVEKAARTKQRNYYNLADPPTFPLLTLYQLHKKIPPRTILGGITGKLMICYGPMATRFFRAGVGTVIYNDSGEIAIFKRTQPPIGLWELQQGGIDVGELPEATLWRELHEEVGIIKDDIGLVTPMPGWTLYERSEGIGDTSINILGQAHLWFFMELKAGREIDLDKSLEDEASEFKWTNFDELISITGPHKKHVYQELQNFFELNIKPALKKN